MNDAAQRRSPAQLREDALAIWHAGVAAVRSDQLIKDHVQVAGDTLLVGDDEISLANIGRIFVVGAGKAGAGMAVGLEEALGERVLAEKDVAGWINVPAGCEQPTKRIQLHPARPAGVNEPTEEGVAGTQEMLRLAEAASANDLLICLISGGGSALMPAPIEGITLADKVGVTRFLSGAGANIAQLNTVRKQLSRIKGGGLARASRAGRTITLIISDVLGDPLDIIASGPTVADSSTPQEALAILEKFQARGQIPDSVFDVITAKAKQSESTKTSSSNVTNLIIGNNATAVDAAGMEAERRGYSHAMHAATLLEGNAEAVGEHLAKMALRMRRESGPDCLITGGEPVVQLADDKVRGRGGRNQQLVLASLIELHCQGDGICLLSGGTDGEDGPTDAAGALFDADIAARCRSAGLDPQDFLQRNDAWNFFAPLDGLIKTGPTHTNVCDIRVVVVDRVEVPHGKVEQNHAR